MLHRGSANDKYQELLERERERKKNAGGKGTGYGPNDGIVTKRVLRNADIGCSRPADRVTKIKDGGSHKEDWSIGAQKLVKVHP